MRAWKKWMLGLMLTAAVCFMAGCGDDAAMDNNTNNEQEHTDDSQQEQNTDDGNVNDVTDGEDSKDAADDNNIIEDAGEESRIWERAWKTWERTRPMTGAIRFGKRMKTRRTPTGKRRRRKKEQPAIIRKQNQKAGCHCQKKTVAAFFSEQREEIMVSAMYRYT